MKIITCLLFIFSACRLSLAQTVDTALPIASFITDPPGFRVIRIDGREQARLNDRYTVYVPLRDSTVKIEMVVKADKSKDPTVVSFVGKILLRRNYRIEAILDYFVLEEETDTAEK